MTALACAVATLVGAVLVYAGYVVGYRKGARAERQAARRMLAHADDRAATARLDTIFEMLERSVAAFEGDAATNPTPRGAVAARWPHKPEVAGAIPAAATILLEDGAPARRRSH